MIDRSGQSLKPIAEALFRTQSKGRMNMLGQSSSAQGQDPSAAARWIIIACVVLLGVGVLMRSSGNAGKASVPALFEPRVTLAEAEVKSSETGRPVFALVTADWCPPCQSLKRNALADPEVVAWIQSNAHPVYIDVSTSSTPEADRIEAQFLPTLAMMRDGKVIARTTGVLDSQSLLQFLAAGTAANQAAPEGR